MRAYKDLRFLKCPKCSFQFIDPFALGDQAFDNYAWTKEFTGKFDRYIIPVIASLRRKIEDVEKIMGRKPRSFLDVGCGNGIYLHAANVLGLKNLGTDVDKVNVEFARAKGLNAAAVALEDLDIGERFDFVHLKAVLHLVPDPGRLLIKARNLMAPGGVVYIDVPNQGSLFSKLRMLRDRTSYGQLQLPFRRGAYNFKSMTFLCRKTGLKIVRRVFAYPGDRTYYPILRAKRTFTLVFRIFAMFRISSMLGVYAVEDDRATGAS